VLDEGLEGGDELGCGGTDADEADALAGKVEALGGPVGGVDAGALEGVEAGGVGPLPGVENAGAVDEEIALVLKVGRGVVVGADGEVPLAGLLLPDGTELYVY
jgi:hypothetical protein